jgi:hypothetical protein
VNAKGKKRRRPGSSSSQNPQKERPRKEREWAPAAVIIKKTHEFAKTPKGVRAVGEHHAGRPVLEVKERPRSWLTVHRPKGCFVEFRQQPRGRHVTVTWGKYAPNAKGKPECR